MIPRRVWRGAAREGGLEFRDADRPRPQQSGRVARQVEDRGFQADGRRPAVEDQVDPTLQVGQDMLGAGRREAVRPIGAGGGQRPAAPGDQVAGDPSRRASHADGRLAGRDDIRNPVGTAKDERQRPGPEPGRQPIGVAGPLRHTFAGLSDIRDMNDQRIDGRAALGREDSRDRRGVGGDGPQAVHRLGREGNQTPAGQDARGLVEHGGIGRSGSTVRTRVDDGSVILALPSDRAAR